MLRHVLCVMEWSFWLHIQYSENMEKKNSSKSWPVHSMTSFSRTCVGCVKGFLSFSLLALTHFPPDMTTSKLWEDSTFGNYVWHCVYNIYGLFRWINQRLSDMSWAFFFHGNLSLFSEYLKLVKERKQNPFFVRPITVRKVVKVSHWWVRGRSAVGTILGEVVVLCMEIELRSAKNEVCDC